MPLRTLVAEAAESLTSGKGFIIHPVAATTPALASGPAHPEWLVQSWSSVRTRFARSVCSYDQSIPVTALRLRTPSAEESSSVLGSNSGRARFWPTRVECSRRYHKTEAFNEGRIAIQDERRNLLPHWLARRTHSGLCAAPVERPGQSPIAIPSHHRRRELHPHRAELLRRRVAANNVQVLPLTYASYPSTSPSIVYWSMCLLRTGTFARNPEIKWRLTPADLADFHSRQVAILHAALKQAKPQVDGLHPPVRWRKRKTNRCRGSSSEERSFRLRDSRAELAHLLNDRVLIAKDPDSLVTDPIFAPSVFIPAMDSSRHLRTPVTATALLTPNQRTSKFYRGPRVHALSRRGILRHDDARGDGCGGAVHRNSRCGRVIAWRGGDGTSPRETPHPAVQGHTPSGMLPVNGITKASEGAVVFVTRGLCEARKSRLRSVADSVQYLVRRPPHRR